MIWTWFAIRTFTLLALTGAAFGTLGPALAQDSDTVVRLDQLEHQMRQLTGTIEQLQFRNQQLEQALRRMQEDYELRFQQLGGKAAAAPGPARPSAGAQPATVAGSQPNIAGRRSDAFDPTQNPNAPGAPRTLGSIPANAAPAPVYSANGNPTSGEALGPPARPAGTPLDLSTPGGAASSSGDLAASNGALPPPPPRNTNATSGQFAAVSPPSQSPRDEYDLAYGYLLRKEYASAADSFRIFLRDYPSDRMAADAQFWLGESMFQQQSYHDAADAFLIVTKNYQDSTKAPDALLRLGQSLAAMGRNDLACATFSEVGHKYPRASLNVKQGVEREQKRVHCS
jgi:tol-pal system protein YbgF